MQTAAPPLHDLAPDLREKYDRLLAIFAEMGSVLIGFSGGVDSTLIAKAAYDALGDRALAVTGISPSLMIEEANECPKIAAHIGIPYREIRTDEMDDPNYVSNPVNRCYFCKSELWDKLTPDRAGAGLRRRRGRLECGRPRRLPPRHGSGQGAGYPLPLAGGGADEGGHPRDLQRARPADMEQAVAPLPLVAHPARDVHHDREVGSGRAGGGVSARPRLPGLPRPAPRRDRAPRTATGDFPKALEQRAAIVDALDRISASAFVTLDLAGFKSGSLNPAGQRERQCGSVARPITACGR